jgi:hypothetical protein
MFPFEGAGNSPFALSLLMLFVTALPRDYHEEVE